MKADLVINALGGNAATARFFGILPGAVSHWRGKYLPPNRAFFLEKLRPDLFQQLQEQAHGNKD